MQDGCVSHTSCQACAGAGCVWGLGSCATLCPNAVLANDMCVYQSTSGRCEEVEDKNNYIYRHNYYRTLHGAPAVYRCPIREGQAVAYAQKMLREVSQRPNEKHVHLNEVCTQERSQAGCAALASIGCKWKYGTMCTVDDGENLSWVSVLDGTFGDAIDTFYHEIAFVDWGNVQVPAVVNEHGIGHFTQMVWSEVMLVGCGKASGMGSDGRAYTFVVCRYNPQGNINGEYQAKVSDCDRSVAFKCPRGKCVPLNRQCDGRGGDCNMPEFWCNARQAGVSESFCILDNGDETTCS